MPTDQIQRLNYYQRQFLGADDFKAQQAYHRDMRRRHHLAHHTWGIVVGLDLVELPHPDDPTLLEPHVMPGMAVDGYGREILVLQPVKLDPADFAVFKDNRLREVWIEYAEEKTRPPAPGYELCATPGQLSRTLETYRLVIHPSGASHPDIVVAGKPLTPPAPPPALPPTPGTLAIPIDESVPHQELPDPETYWRIRLGNVLWDGLQRRFLAAPAGELDQGRQYLGLVSASLLAPHHQIRLKDRSAFTDATQETDHLVGIEGKLRVDEDAHFRLNVGVGTLNPQKNLSVEKGLNLDQADANTGVLEPGLTFGSNSTEGLASRRTAGGNQHGLDLYTAATVRLSITNAGLVGINTTAPTHRLHLNDVRGLRQNRLYLTGDAGWSSLSYNATHNAANSAWEFPDSNRPAVTIEMDDAGGTPRFQVYSTTTSNPTTWIQRLAVNGNTGTVLLAHNGGSVGIGTTAPALKLHVEGDLGRPNGPCTLNLFGSRIADTGNGVLSLQSGGGVVAFNGADNVGVGTANPALKLHVEGDLGRPNGPCTLNLFGSRIGDTGNGVLSLQSGGSVVAFNGSDDIGIGTDTPAARLHVRDTLNGDASLLSSHVAVLENLSTGTSADVLALKIGRALPTDANNFITFFAGNTIAGRIEGNNSPFTPGITFLSGSGDFAEALPRLDPEEALEPGDLVGVHAGHVSRRTAGAHHVLAVTDRAVVIGNAPPAGQRHLYATIAFLGQLPVKVRGPIQAGDFILPSGLDDGTGVAWSPTTSTPQPPGPIVGRAWESAAAAGVKRVLTAIGLAFDTVTAAPAAGPSTATELAAVRRDLEELRARLDKPTRRPPRSRRGR
jgi:hypothetical protein